MKLLKKSPTNSFKEINFGELNDNNNRNFEVLGLNNEWKKVKKFEKICRDKSKVINTKLGKLVCHHKHRLLTNLGEVFANNLATDHKLIGYNNEEVDFTITDGGYEDFYDIEIDGPHWYYTSGIISHNSILLVNTAISNILKGKKVLHISLENSEKVTGHRYMGAFTNIPIALKSKKEEEIKLKSRKIKASSGNGELFIIYFPTDTISVREIELSIKELKRQHGFVPDVLVVDYLECLLSKNPYKNKDDYSRQKSVSSELRALAAITNTYLASASQTNRGGAKSADEGHNLNLDNLAESFGKAMPTDYVISINQSQKQYNDNGSNESHIGHVRFFIAKNRNGPKFKVVNGKINYATMKTIQEDVQDN